MKRLLGLFISFMMAMALMVPVSAEGNETIDVDVDVKYQQTSARSMLKLINDWRNAGSWYYDSSNNKVETGSLPSYTYDYDLEAIAMKRAAQLAAVFAHQQPDGRFINDLTSNGVGSSGENILCGLSDPQSAFELWQENDAQYDGQGHRRAMLSSRFKTIGIGHAAVGYVDFWVQEFGVKTPVSGETAANDSDTTETLTIAKNLIQGLEVYLDQNLDANVDYGDPITLPKCMGRLDIKGGFVPLPVKAATISWGTTDLGTVNGNTLTLNSDIYNKEISLPIDAHYLEWSGTMNQDYYVMCTHKQLKYVSIDEYEHKNVCAICGEKMGTESHHFGEAQIVKQPTVNEEAQRQYVCKQCGYVKEERLSKLKQSKTTPAKVTIYITQQNTKQNVYTFQKVTVKATGAKSFKSSNKKIATVSKKGALKLKKAGTVKITFKKGSKKYTVTLKVMKPALKLNASKVTLKKGKTYTLKVMKVTPVNPVKFSVKNKKMVSVSSKGVITGKKKGTTYVYAKVNGLKKTIKVTVK